MARASVSVKEQQQTGAAYEAGVDPRLDFLFDYLTRSLKIKIDKWQKLVMTEEYRNVLNEFFDNPDTPVSHSLHN
jgi:hypothetical protein